MSKINITSLEFDSEFDLEPIRVINQWANEQIEIGRELGEVPF